MHPQGEKEPENDIFVEHHVKKVSGIEAPLPELFQTDPGETGIDGVVKGLMDLQELFAPLEMAEGDEAILFTGEIVDGKLDIQGRAFPIRALIPSWERTASADSMESSSTQGRARSERSWK
jgi:hypothetical protein